MLDSPDYFNPIYGFIRILFLLVFLIKVTRFNNFQITTALTISNSLNSTLVRIQQTSEYSIILAISQYKNYFLLHMTGNFFHISLSTFLHVHGYINRICNSFSVWNCYLYGNQMVAFEIVLDCHISDSYCNNLVCHYLPISNKILLFEY